MADGQQVDVVGGAANSLSEQGSFETIVANQHEKTTAEETTDIVSMAFADIDETPAYLQTVSDESNLPTVDNVTLQATPAETDASPASENVTTVQPVHAPQTIASTDAVDVSTLGNGNDSAAVNMPASMLLGSIANLIDNSAAAATTSSTMTISELQSNPSLMNILNSAEVQAAIQNNQHITIVQVPDRSIIGELNGDKTITSVQTTNIHSNMPPLGPISSFTRGFAVPRQKVTTVSASLVPPNIPITNATLSQPKVTSTKTTTTVMTPTKQSTKSEKNHNQNKTSKSDEKKKPHRAVTRSGRVSKPPSYRVRDYKTLRTGALTVSSDTEDDYSDYTPDDDDEDDADRSENFKYPFGSERPKKFKCVKCEKSYIGRAGLARHFKLNPTHGKEEDIPEPPPLPKISDGERPPPRRPGRPPRVQNNSATTSNLRPLASKPVPTTSSPSTSMSNSTSSTAGGTIKGVSLLNQTEIPSDVKVVYPPQSLAKRKQRIRELLKTIGDEDVLELVLPRLSKLVTVWEFLLMKVEKGRPSRPHFSDVYKELCKVVTEIKKMAEECLEPISEEELANVEETDFIKLVTQTIDIKDEAMAHVLGIKTGSFNVKESPVPEYEFKYKLLVTDPSEAERMPKERRIIEVVSQDELVDQSASKRRKLDHIQQAASPRKSDVESSPVNANESQPNSSNEIVPTTTQQSPKMPPLRRIVNRIQPIASTSKPDGQLLSNPKPDNVVFNTPKPDSQLLSTPKTNTLPFSTPKSDTQLHSTPKPDTQLHSTPKPETQLPNNPKPDTSTVATLEPKLVDNSSDVAMQPVSSNTVTERQILTLPPGYIMSKTLDGYTIEKPDGSTIHITGTGDGGIPLETIQALLSIDPTLFQTETTNSEPSVVESNEATTHTVVKEDSQNTDSIVPTADTTSVAMETDDQTQTTIATQETVFAPDTELPQQEVIQQPVMQPENMENAFSQETVIQETVAMSTSVCSETSALNVSDGQMLTNGNSVESTTGLENAIVNNVA